MKTTYSDLIFDSGFWCAVTGGSNNLQALGRFIVQRFAPVLRSGHRRKACDPKMACMGYGIRRYPSTQTLGQAVDFSPAGTFMGNAADSKQAVYVNDDITLSPDKAYGAADTCNTLTVTKAVPHMAQNTCGPKSALKERVVETEVYTILQKKSKRNAQENSRAEFIGPCRRATVRGIEKAGQLFLLLKGQTATPPCNL